MNRLDHVSPAFYFPEVETIDCVDDIHDQDGADYSPDTI